VANNEKVVLVIPYEAYLTKEYLPSIGLAYVASSLEREGYNVVIVDSQAEGLFDCDDIIKTVKRLNPDIVGITATTHTRFIASELVSGMKKELNKFIFAGGSHFSATDIDALQNISGIDLIIRGDAEYIVKEVVNSYFCNKEFSDISGITYRKSNGQIKQNNDAPMIPDLDLLDPPAWHLYDMSKYHAEVEVESSVKAIGVMSTRGCPAKCTFCFNPYRTIRRIDYMKFVDMLEELKINYGFEGIDFWDDTFTAGRKYATAVCEEIIRRKLNIRWYARARVTNVNNELLSLMRKAGCVSIAYGVESGSDRVLKLNAKGTKIETVRKAIKLSLVNGLITKSFFLYGLIGETIEDIGVTYDFMKEIDDYGDKSIITYGQTRIYPGTNLDLYARKIGTLDPNFSWNKYIYYDKYKKLGLDPMIPHFENGQLTVEQVHNYIRDRRFSARNVFFEGVRRIKSIKKFNDVKSMYGGLNRVIGHYIKR